MLAQPRLSASCRLPQLNTEEPGVAGPYRYWSKSGDLVVVDGLTAYTHELGDGRPAACLDVAQDFVALAVNAELQATGVRGLTQVDGGSVGGLRGLLNRGAYLASSGALTDQRISSRRLRLRQPSGVRTMLWW